MASERPRRPPPQERTFGQVFPWRNIRRALMLVLVILAIIMIKRSTGPLLARVGDTWGAPASVAPASGRTGPRDSSDPSIDHSLRRIRLGPGLAPTAAPGPARDAPAR
jgi:hypothetical protein